jgi:hypothetical protein
MEALKIPWLEGVLQVLQSFPPDLGEVQIRRSWWQMLQRLRCRKVALESAYVNLKI